MLLVKGSPLSRLGSLATELLLTMRAADAFSVVQVAQRVYQNELIFVRLEPK